MLATEFVKEKYRRDSEDDLEDAGDTRGEQSDRGRGQAEAREDLWRVVQDGVDTGLRRYPVLLVLQCSRAICHC